MVLVFQISLDMVLMNLRHMKVYRITMYIMYMMNIVLFCINSLSKLYHHKHVFILTSILCLALVVLLKETVPF